MQRLREALVAGLPRIASSHQEGTHSRALSPALAAWRPVPPIVTLSVASRRPFPPPARSAQPQHPSAHNGVPQACLHAAIGPGRHSVGRPAAGLSGRPRNVDGGNSSLSSISAVPRAWRAAYLVDCCSTPFASAHQAWRGLHHRAHMLEPLSARRHLSGASREAMDGVTALSSVTLTAKVFNDGLDPMVRRPACSGSSMATLCALVAS